MSDTTPPLADLATIPSPPAEARILTAAELEEALGPLPFTALPNDPSGIEIAREWSSAHLVTTSSLPSLAGKPLCGMEGHCSGKLTLHRAVKAFLEKAFDAIHRAGLSDVILCWGGAFTPRRQRGSTLVSRHAYGIAFDINTQWNPYRMPPAPPGRTGSVAAIVPILLANGFYWGGWFKNNPDGMHFEWVGEPRHTIQYPSKYCPNLPGGAIDGVPGLSVQSAPDGGRLATMFADDALVAESLTDDGG